MDLRLGEGGYSLCARLAVSLPCVERSLARSLVDEAHRICPYSKATRGNVEVLMEVV